MARPRECDGCRQAHACQEVYGKLGDTEGPSVTRAALVAFALPLALFVAALGGWDHLLRNRVAEPHQTPLTLVLAVGVTALSMLAVCFFARRHQKK